jgi:hypothetical protein
MENKMLVKCNKCKKPILTECDAYVIIPVENYTINCGCYYVSPLDALLNTVFDSLPFVFIFKWLNKKLKERKNEK